jgi:two-component system nitrogen regulation response regulator NtrX
MLKNKISILVVDDEIDICEMVAETLRDENYNAIIANNYDQAVEMLKNENITILITDIWMNNKTNAGLQLLTFSQNYDPLIPVIMMSGHGNIETAMKAAKSGAYDFIEKPFKAERLILLIEKALQDRNLKLKVLDFESKENARMSLIGRSAIFKNIKQKLNKISSTNSRVLINGPSGSGKELIARWIHKKSNRGSYPFIVASCATLSPERVEQVLFGWNEFNSEGNNNQSNIGLFEQANYGTLFFDEICDLPIQTQGKLVQAIQDQSFYKIGSNKKINVDVRIISASNRKLLESVQQGLLREDLFYRLSVVPIEVPPLCKRSEDIIDLIDYFLNVLAKDLGSNKLKLSSETIVILENYEWPGNVRQLKNIIEWLNIMYGNQKNSIILPSHLPPEVLGFNEKEKDNHISNHLSLSLKDARKDFEERYLIEQLKRFKGSIAKTSTFIGMDRSALHRKLKELNINIKK